MQVSEWTINIQVVGVVAIVCIVLGYVVAAEFYRKRLCRVAIQLDISREGNKHIMLQLSTLQSQLKDTEIRSDELKAETRQLREQLQSVSDSRHRLLVELNGRKVEVGLVRQELTQVREKQTKSKIIEFSPELIPAKKLVIPETKHAGTNSVTSVDDTEEARSSKCEIDGAKYKLQCRRGTFTAEEIDILEKYGTWLSGLASGKIEPETDMQRKFVQECKYYRALSSHEMSNWFQRTKVCNVVQVTWFKYLRRLRFERENPSMVENATIDWGWQGPPVSSGEHVFFSR